MGCRFSTQSQNRLFPSSSDDLMFKIFTFPSSEEAKTCMENFSRQKQESEEFQLKIQTIQEMERSQNEGWKVIIGIEYPEQSLRAIIIQRKKSKDYFTMQRVFEVLELTTEFILKYKDKICKHLDIFAYLFTNNQGTFKICSPQVLYGFCRKKDCKKLLSKQMVIRQILEMILMEKISRVDYWKLLKQVQYIYPHYSSQLYKLLVNLFRPEQTLDKILEQYLQLKQMAKAIQSINHSNSVKEHCSSQLPSQSKFYEDSTQLFKANYIQKAIDEQYQQIETPKNVYNDYRTTNFFTNKREISKSFMREDIPEESPHLQDSIKVSPFQDLQSNQNIRYDRSQEENSQDLSQSKKITLKLINLEFQDWNNFKEENSYLYKEKEQQSIELQRATIPIQEGQYVGYLKQRKKFGKGKLTYKNGMIYDGQWMQDKKNGQGKLYYQQGSLCYSGYWKDDMQHGLGTTINNNPQKIEGYFDYKDFSNVFQKGLWKQYKGMFQKDWIEGQGTLVLSNGETLTTFWRQGMADGRGEFVNLDGKIFKGVWSESILECELQSKSSKNSITVEQDF